MNNKLNNSFILPVGRDFLIYSPLAGISALINHSAAMALKNQLRGLKDPNGDPSPKLFELASAILENEGPRPSRKTGDLNPDFLGIITTRSCNSACRYCDFGAGDAPVRKMPYKLASKAIDWYSGLLKRQERTAMHVHFFGGEPMVARDVVEVAVHRARLVAMEQNLIPFFEISTNGQYGEDDARFLGTYFNKVVLSFDGPEDIQNKHRPLKAGKSGYLNTVRTARIISNSNADLCIRACVTRDNLSRMEEFTGWLCNEFNPSAINFEILSSSELTNAANLFPPDPFEFAVNFQKSRVIAEKYGIDLIYSSDIIQNPVVSSCPVGKDTAIISPDGRISNCYLMPEKWVDIGLDLDFGAISQSGVVRINEEKIGVIRKMVEDKPRCSNCFCKWSCAGGCHVGITFPGCDPVYDNHCLQTRLISAFTLLSGLGLPEKINQLMENPEAMHRLAFYESDSLKTHTDPTRE